MNCPTCKNPIQAYSKKCEWCGSEINSPINQFENSEIKTKTILKFIYNGEWFLVDNQCDIYLNDIFLIKGSVKKGFSFEIENKLILPIIKIKFSFRNKVLKLPALDVSKNYLIEIEFSRVWGNFCAEPKIIKEI